MTIIVATKLAYEVHEVLEVVPILYHYFLCHSCFHHHDYMGQHYTTSSNSSYVPVKHVDPAYLLILTLYHSIPSGYCVNGDTIDHTSCSSAQSSTISRWKKEKVVLKGASPFNCSRRLVRRVALH